MTEPKKFTSKKKGVLFHLIYFPLVTLVVLFLVEGTARLMGYRPWEPRQADIVVEPGGKFYAKHQTLGYTHLAGQYKLTLSQNYTFFVTNLADTLRATHPSKDIPSAGKEGIWLFGDSITYGWSVNDEQSYPWLLQKKLPNYEIVNFGVDGYGTLHSFIQLREALQKRTQPKVVVVAYASWHDVRNTFVRLRRKMLITSTNLGALNHPYARFGSNGKLEVFMDTTGYSEVPLMRYSAFVNALAESYDNYEAKHSQSHEITKVIMKEISDLCRLRGVELVVVGLSSDPTTADMLEYCSGQGIKTATLWVDYLNIKENNNLPYDSHPSAVAHQQYASKLEAFLRSSGLTAPPNTTK